MSIQLANTSSAFAGVSWQAAALEIQQNQLALVGTMSAFDTSNHSLEAIGKITPLQEKSIGFIFGERVLAPTIDKIATWGGNFFHFIGESYKYINRATSFPPGVAAFGLSDLDPTNKNSALRKGVKELDPTNKNSAVGKGLKELDPTNKNSALRKGVKELDPTNKNSAVHKGLRNLGKHIEAGANNVVKVITGEHKINPKSIAKAFQKAGDDVKKEWDRAPTGVKAAVVIAAAAAAGYGAAYLVIHGTTLSLGVAGSNGIVVEVLTYSAAGGLEVVPLASGGVLSAAAWVNFYDDLNKADSIKAFEEKPQNLIPLPLGDESLEESNGIINSASENDLKDFTITLENSEPLSLQLFEDFSKKPDRPDEPAWIEPDNPIRQVMPNIPAGGNSYQRRIIRRQTERLARALQSDWGRTMASGHKSMPVKAARAAGIFSVIHDFIRMELDQKEAVRSFLRDAMVNTYGGCDYPTISSPSFDSDAVCAAEKQEAARIKAEELYQSIKDDISRKYSDAARRRWEEVERQNPARREEAIEDIACYID